jgi:peptidoglycan/xylan/chitin deacetylase (PgdA/CDA1 family)
MMLPSPLLRAAEGAGEAASDVQPAFIMRGPGFGNRIAITFDDGPSPGVTNIVLQELEKRNLKATFFMIGSKVDRFPSLAKEVVDAGHEVANHSYTHPALSSLPDDRVRWELAKCQEAIHNATGKTPVWFRPPYGAFRPNQGHLAREAGLGIAIWSVDPRDWAKPGESAIISRIMTTTTPGSIILLHDLHQQTANAVSGVLSGLRERSYSFANLSRFIGRPYAV